MKQYLLLLRNIDFTKDGNQWISPATNVYVNNSYTNYSYKRSRYGNNLASDFTYTGIEVASPSFFDDDVELLSSTSVYKTDIGEVIYEPATPSLLRLVDTTSRVDLVSYRIFFTNLLGDQVPSATFTFEESDNEDGPWLKSVTANDAASAYEKNIKPYFRVILDFNVEDIIPANLGILLYIEFVIHDPSVPVVSKSVQEILSRFPSWTDLYADSLEQATPNLYVPISTGGRFVNALLQEHLDTYENRLVDYELNSFIQSIDTEILDWVYKSDNVSANIISVYGDGIQLSPVGSIYDFYISLKTDYVYYYNAVNREIITNRKYEGFAVNGEQYEQNPILSYNELDELGARVGLPRLFLEENERYKLRILDTYRNPPSVNVTGFKNTLRRELDIWRAYGATPDSDYAGATPEVLEISDLELSTPYFDSEGKPLPEFRKFVEKINQKYPSNFGYVKWGEGTWDYSGILQEGVSRIPAIYDNSVDLGDKFQPGVGDVDDLKFNAQVSTIDEIPFSAKVIAKGIVQDEVDLIYPPIYMDYQYYLNYSRTVPAQTNTQLGLVYEVDIFNEDLNSTDTYYANLNSDNREDFVVRNSFSATSDASPEFNYVSIFDQDGFAFSEINFRDKVSNELYYGEQDSISTAPINVYDAEEVRVVMNTLGWDQETQEYIAFPYSTNSRISFSINDTNYIVQPSYALSMTIATPNVDAYKSNLLIGSNIYGTKNETFESEIFSRVLIMNNETDLSSSTPQYASVSIGELYDNILFPSDANPESLTVNPVSIRIENGLEIPSAYSFNPENDEQVFLSTSSEILLQAKDSSGENVGTSQNFTSINIPFDSNIEYLVFSKDETSTSVYPFERKLWNPFSVEFNEEISGTIDRFNTIRLDGSGDVFSVEDNFVSRYSLSRENFGITDSFEYNFKLLEIENIDNRINFYSNFYLDDISSNEQFNLALSPESTGEDSEFQYSVFARRNEEEIRFISPSIRDGWVHLDQKAYYNYSKPKIETFYGKFFEIELEEIPRRGSPVYVEVSGKQYRQIPVDKETEFGRIYEKVKGNNSHYLYASYEDIDKAIVYDEYLGKTIATNISSSTNILEPFNDATPSILGREYSLSYSVKDSFYLQKDFYKEEEDAYTPKIDFFATPNTDQLYHVIYETDLFNTATPIDLSLDAKNNPLNQGYVYVSKENYPFSYVKAFVSPNVIKSTENSLMNLVIISFDENDNPKPYQAFSVEGENITCEPQYILTNSNGVGFGVVRYNSSTFPSSGFIGNVVIEGIGLTEYFRLVESGQVRITEDGEVRLASYDIPEEFYEFYNSDSGSYTKNVEYYIASYREFEYEIKAVVDKLIIAADGIGEQYIYGKVTDYGSEISEPVTVYYRITDSVRDLFEGLDLDIDNSVETNDIGEFTIGPIAVNTKYNPGYRFCLVETMATLDIETPEDSTTIAGDVVYWYEQYDSVHYNTELLPPPLVYNKNIISEHFMLATPNFVLNTTNPDQVIYTGSTPNWLPPKWYPINMRMQYQLGIFGSTPNFVVNYNNLHPDYQEE